MKPQMIFDTDTLASNKLDNLATRKWLINIETGIPQAASRPNGKPITGFSPLNVRGLYVRLNGTNTHDHGLVCVRSSAVDKTTGRKGDGAKLHIGKLSDFKIGDREYDIDAIVERCADLYVNGEQAAPTRSGSIITVSECLDEYLSDRMAKLDGDEIVKLNRTAITKSMATLEQVVTTVKRYAWNWLDVCVTKIDSTMITKRAAQIRDGAFENSDGDLIGRYSTARAWLGAMSTIHKAGAMRHESVNLFEVLRKKSYPKLPSPQRRFTDEEIAIILNWKLEDTPHGRLVAPDVSKYIRVLAVKFSLLTVLRCGDLVTLKERDIEEHNGRRYLKKLISKGGRWQWFPITDRAGEIINKALELSPHSEYIFPAAHGGKYGCGTKAFEVIRDMLGPKTAKNPNGLGLIKPEPVEVLKNETPKKRLICSHDVRRTLETLGGAVSDKDGKRVVDQPTIDHMMQHKGSALAAQYNCKTEVDHIALADYLYPSYEAYADHLFGIAKAGYRS